MKQKLIKAIFAIIINTIIGVLFATILGFDLWAGVVAINLLGFLMPFVKLPVILREGVYVEVWCKEMLRRSNRASEGQFLDGVPDYSSKANNDIIHLTDVSGKIDIKINNTSYPLIPQTLDDADIPISLDKIETVPTSVTSDELHAISYDKMGVVNEEHGIAITEGRLDKAIHAFAPTKHTTATPVLLTTGDLVDGRRRLQRTDLVALRRAMDSAGFAKAGRRLVLCSDHVNDLLECDQKFQNQYHDYSTGAIFKMYGFEIMEYSNNPKYTPATKTKKAFGAAEIVGDVEASVCFIVRRMFKAIGSMKMSYSKEENDPLNKRNLVSFTNRFVALPLKEAQSVAAIISANA